MNIFNFLKTSKSREVAIVPIAEKVYDEVFEIRSERYAQYEVEHFTFSENFFPRWQQPSTGVWFYLKRNFFTGVVEVRRGIEWADSFKTEAEAWYLVDLAIEQVTKDTVRVLKR